LSIVEHRWIHDLIERVEFDETFDAVVCWDSLFHLPRHQFRPVISRVHRWLKPHGRTMVSSGGGLARDDGKGFTDTMCRFRTVSGVSSRDHIAWAANKRLQPAATGAIMSRRG